MRSRIAAALIVAPLLIAATIAYWPSRRVVVSTVLIPAPNVHSRSEISDLANEVAGGLAEQLYTLPKLKVQIAKTIIDSNEAAAFDAVVLTTLTEDAGIVQLNVQVVSPRTHTQIWSNTYQAPREQFRDMLRAAANGVRQALD